MAVSTGVDVPPSLKESLAVSVLCQWSAESLTLFVVFLGDVLMWEG